MALRKGLTEISNETSAHLAAAPQDGSGLPAASDQTVGYLALDWLLRTWLPLFFGPESDLGGKLKEFRPVSNTDRADAIGPFIQELTPGFQRAEEQQRAEANATMVGRVCDKAATAFVKQALVSTAGRLTADVAARTVPDAHYAAKAASAIEVGRILIYSDAFDAAWNGAERILPQTNSDTAQTVLNNLLPAACRIGMKDRIQTAAISATRLHNSMLGVT